MMQLTIVKGMQGSGKTIVCANKIADTGYACIIESNQEVKIQTLNIKRNE